MLATTSLTESPVAIRVDLGAIFVSMELSRSKWLITSLSPGGGEKMSKHTLVGGDLVGPEFGAVLCSECLFRRFDNRRQVTAFAGLAPTPWQSGQIDREQGVSKAGSPRLRKTLIELSWLCSMQQRRRAWTYRWMEQIGKWSMMDVMLLALLVMMIKLSGVVQFHFGPALIAFVLCVSMSMISAICFDPHAIWESP